MNEMTAATSTEYARFLQEKWKIDDIDSTVYTGFDAASGPDVCVEARWDNGLIITVRELPKPVEQSPKEDE